MYLLSTFVGSSSPASDDGGEASFSMTLSEISEIF